MVIHNPGGASVITAPPSRAASEDCGMISRWPSTKPSGRNQPVVCKNHGFCPACIDPGKPCSWAAGLRAASEQPLRQSVQEQCLPGLAGCAQRPGGWNGVRLCVADAFSCIKQLRAYSWHLLGGSRASLGSCVSTAPSTRAPAAG